MSEEKELVFIKPEDVPKLLRGGSRDKKWDLIFKQIPKGEVLVMNEDYGLAQNVRAHVKTYNKIYKDEELTATQRTDKKTEKVTVYVQRVK